MRETDRRLIELERIVAARKARQAEPVLDKAELLRKGEEYMAELRAENERFASLSPEERAAELAAFARGRTLQEIIDDFYCEVQEGHAALRRKERAA